MSTTTNASLQQRKDAATPRGVGVMCGFYADHAKNAEVWDIEGRRYIDFAGGIGVLNTGHLNEKVAAAVAAPMPLEPPTSHTTRPDQSITGVFRGLNQGKKCMRCSIVLIAAYAISASVNARFFLNFRHCAGQSSA